MNTYLPKVFPITMAILLTACGGGGSNSGTEVSQNNSPSPGPQCSPASTTNPYLATSYDSCGASNNNLSGRWVVVSHFVSAGNNREADQQQRTLMTIRTNNDGSLTADVCNPNVAQRNVTFAAGSSTLEFFDSVAATTIQLSITSNVAMQGTHISNGSTIIQSSTVSAIKISDSATVPGTLNLSYLLNGYNFSQTGLPITCFKQYKGTVRITNAPITFTGESSEIITSVNNNGTIEDARLNIFKPEDPTDETDIFLRFLTSNMEIEGEGANFAAFITQLNDRTGVKFNGSVIDQPTPTNTATFAADITF